MKGKRNLLIDDEEQFRSMLGERLEAEGYEVVGAKDGRQGLKLFRDDSYDLVITDIIMPEKEGMELIMELRQEYPEVKIIAVSGGKWSATDSLLFMARKFGAQEVFAKPFDWDEFMEAVKKLLGEEEE